MRYMETDPLAPVDQMIYRAVTNAPVYFIYSDIRVDVPANITFEEVQAAYDQDVSDKLDKVMSGSFTFNATNYYYNKRKYHV